MNWDMQQWVRNTGVILKVRKSWIKLCIYETDYCKICFRLLIVYMGKFQFSVLAGTEKPSALCEEISFPSQGLD